MTIGGTELAHVSGENLATCVTYIGHNSYLFKGTVRDNLQMGRPDADDDALWDALEQTRLAGFVRAGGGLDMELTERGANLSGGQRQRLALARALLHDTPVYIFDEATSNIDVESEDAILEIVHRLARTRTVLFISHRPGQRGRCGPDLCSAERHRDRKRHPCQADRSGWTLQPSVEPSTGAGTGGRRMKRSNFQIMWRLVQLVRP